MTVDTPSEPVHARIEPETGGLRYEQKERHVLQEKNFRLVIDVPPSLHCAIKVRAAERGLTMRDYVIGLAQEPEASERRDEQKERSALRRKDACERLGVYLPPEILAAVRHAAVNQKRSVSDAITEAVCAWLKGQPK